MRFLRQLWEIICEVWDRFFWPDMSSTLPTVLICLFNSFCFLVGLSIPVCLWFFLRRNKKPSKEKRQGLWWLPYLVYIVYILSAGLLSVLVIWLAAHGGPGANYPHLAKLYVMFQRAFALDSLYNGRFHGLQYLMRVLVLVIYVYVLFLPHFWVSKFRNFIINRAAATQMKKGTETKSAQNGKTLDVGSDDKKYSFWERVIKWAGEAILLAAFVYINSQDEWEHFFKVLDWIIEIIERVTLFDRVSPDASYAYNVFLIISSLLILGFVFAAVTFAYALVFDRDSALAFVKEVIKGLTKLTKRLVEGIVNLLPDIILILVAAFFAVVLYALGYFIVVGVRALAPKVAETLAAIFPPTTEELFKLVPYFLALMVLLAVFACAVALLFLLCTFLRASYRSVRWKLNGRLDWSYLDRDEQRINASTALWNWFKRYRAVRHNIELSVFAVTLLTSVGYIVLYSLQHPESRFSLLAHTPEQVAQATVFFVSLVLGICAIIGSAGLAVVFVIAVVRYVIDTIRQREELREKRSLISLLMNGIGKLLETVIRILTGFRNDVQKNQAIYLACAMASVASLLNTYFGLRKFFNDGTIIPNVCSVAIAVAVQLAVLIFGMRAGEAVREGLFLRKSRTLVRAPARLYCLAMAFFILISTGFAYTNMFGLYARSVNLQEQVMDQVRSEAANEMELSGRVNTVVNRYEANRREILSLLAGDVDVINTKYASDKAELDKKLDEEDKINKENYPDDKDRWSYSAQNTRNDFLNKTRDYQDVTAALKTLLQTDYVDIDKTSANITIEQYDHYYGGNNAASYTTSYIEVSNGETTLVIGTKVDTGELTSITIKDVTYQLVDRYIDPDSSSYSISKHRRVVPEANLYDCINEVLSRYTELGEFILSYVVPSEAGKVPAPITDKPVPDTGKSKSDAEESLPHNKAIDQIRTKLDENHHIDDARGNLFSLYEGDFDPKETVASLPRLVDLYVEQEDDSEEPTPEPPASDETNDKKQNQPSKEEKLAQETAKLHEYLRRLKHVSHCLAPVEAVIKPTEMENQTAEESASAALPSADEESATETKKAEETAVAKKTGDRDAVLSKYESYANSLTKKEFKISFDVFFRGWLGMNPVKTNIHAHYSEQFMAIFLFVICLLIDLMSFAAGLLLYKPIYQFFPRKGKNKNATQNTGNGSVQPQNPGKSGALDMESLLIDYFSPPDDKAGREKKIQEIKDILEGGQLPAQLRLALYQKGGVLSTKNVRLWLESYVKEEGLKIP